MKLNTDQINQIKTFVEDKGIKYPDVQLEAIDHVASRVEELMTTDAQLSTNEAIGITYAEFGATGFKIFEKGMSATLRKKNYKFFVAAFLSCFNWRYLPGIALFLYVFDKVYLMVNETQHFFIVVYAVLTIVFLVFGIIQTRKLNRYDKLLTLRMVLIYNSGLTFMIVLWSYVCILKLYQPMNDNVAAIVFGLLLVVIIFLFITVNRVNNAVVKTCAELNEKYQLLSTK
jgi:hypothetical protein